MNQEEIFKKILVINVVIIILHSFIITTILRTISVFYINNLNIFLAEVQTIKAVDFNKVLDILLNYKTIVVKLNFCIWKALLSWNLIL